MTQLTVSFTACHFRELFLWLLIINVEAICIAAQVPEKVDIRELSLCLEFPEQLDLPVTPGNVLLFNAS
jgi:hypothetical protein